MRGWMIILVALAVVSGGCEPSAESAGMRKRQDRALKDPFNYSPYDDDRTDISGGGLTDFKKDDFKKDVNSVLSP